MKIICNGDVHSALVLDDNDKPIGRVSRVEIVIDAQEKFPSAVITVFNPQIEYTGPGEIKKE